VSEKGKNNNPSLGLPQRDYLKPNENQIFSNSKVPAPVSDNNTPIGVFFRARPLL
jgi:hypothetical protein